MASTNALFSGLSGLNVNARRLEVIGNNVSNVNTTAFKSNRILFASAFSRTFSLGSGPTSTSGGTNPGQVGLGVGLAGTQRNFANGAISATGIPTDLAIEGDGFFIVERAGSQLYTRAGAFQLNSQNELVTVTGDRVQGFPVDSEFNVVTGGLVDVEIPLGTLTIAEATENVTFSGNLNADGAMAVEGSEHVFAPLLDSGGVPIVLGTLLTDLQTGPFVAGDTITISGAERGGKTVPDASFAVGAGSTVDDFLAFLQEVVGVVPVGGVDTAAGEPDEPGSYSVAADGSISFIGNFGEANDLLIETTNFQVADSTGTPKANPFLTTKTRSADGESVRTGFTVYDSLGTEVQIDLTMVLSERNDDGTGWRAFLHSSDDTDIALHLEQGERGAAATELVPRIEFDNFGALVPASQVAVEVDRDLTGALNPFQFSLRFDGGGQEVSALSDTGGNSTIAAVFQDGSPLGVLSSFSVGDTGEITGGFTNGLTRTLGQVAIAKFTNPEGLVDAGNNLFAGGPNSGTALVTQPLDFGTGRVIGGSLELSNVDLGKEFTDMILTQTGYSASARVISTTDELMQELLLLGR